MAFRLKNAAKIAAVVVLAGAIAAGTAVTALADNKVDRGSSICANVPTQYEQFSNDSVNTWSSADTLMTWNKIDSEQDYEEFLTLTKQSGGVKVLLVFTDPVTNERYTISGYNLSGSTDYFECANLYRYEWEESNDNWPYWHERLYWMNATDSSGSGTRSAVQSISSTTDGLSALKNGASHVVTMGDVGSFTAVADASTADTDDFNLLINTTDGSTQYLDCREGFPAWWEEHHSVQDNDFRMMFQPPVLSARTYTSTTDYKVGFYPYYDQYGSKNYVQWIQNNDFAMGTGDYGGKTRTGLNVSGAWKIGTWATSNGSSEKSWSSCYIYQQTVCCGYLYQETWKSLSDKCKDSSGYYYQYAYALLAAQSHSNISLFTATEWESKRPLEYYSSPEYLYSDCGSNASEDVVGAPRNSGNRSDHTLYLQTGFDIYYAVDGISYTAMYGDSGYNGNANNATSTNVASVNKIWSEDTTIGGTDESGKRTSSVYTVDKGYVAIVPRGVQLTIEEDSTLIVSSGGVLVLNGGILNKGQIIVQPGGRILRYDGAEVQSYREDAGTAITSGAIVNHDNTVVRYTYLNDLGDDWTRNSCILCQGGNLVVRKNGRIRVTSLAVGAGSKWSDTLSTYNLPVMTVDSKTGARTTGGSRTLQIRIPEDLTTTPSTVMIYGYVQASTASCSSHSFFTVDGGKIQVGDVYSEDLISTVGILDYSGINEIWSPNLKNGAAIFDSVFQVDDTEYEKETKAEGEQ